MSQIKNEFAAAKYRIKVSSTDDARHPVLVTGLTNEPIRLSDGAAQALAEMLADSDPEYQHHRMTLPHPLPYWRFKYQKDQVARRAAAGQG